MVGSQSTNRLTPSLGSGLASAGAPRGAEFVPTLAVVQSQPRPNLMAWLDSLQAGSAEVGVLGPPPRHYIGK